MRLGGTRPRSWDLGGFCWRPLELGVAGDLVAGFQAISALSGRQVVLVDQRQNEAGSGAVGCPSIPESLFKCLLFQPRPIDG